MELARENNMTEKILDDYDELPDENIYFCFNCGMELKPEEVYEQKSELGGK